MAVTRDKIELQGREVYFDLRFSDRRTVGISVFPNSRIEVVAPRELQIERIRKVLERRGKWILQQLDEVEKVRPIETKRRYSSGQSIRLLGRDYMLKISEIAEYEEEEIKKEHRVIFVKVRDRSQMERINLLIEDWYRNEALVYLASKFEECFEKVRKYNIPKPVYYLRYMNQRWGSCTPEGVIYLNPDLIQLPSHCVEYAILHELCHLKHKDHSGAFYAFLETVLPDWQIRAKDLNSFFQN